ncbi:hypothetical protein [Rhodophyticola porphyridii]|uniref:Uncharacterized protein n=1 Tax=Rhodophyticola porphyridii TaxID=1852017 RepID=A0A3L9XYZ2_9RHOB|nr:hypothetical protein [Rhodophyticola porphyridii]RMA41452.1 hypothetical protein D9R08_14135 [Rhodophyticola porphyridii]
MPGLEDVLAFAAMQRVAERAFIFLFVIILCGILVWAYRKAVQRIDFNISADKVGAGGVVVLAMPVFLLLVMVGFSYIVFSQPVTVRSLSGIELNEPDKANGEEQENDANDGDARPSSAPTTMTREIEGMLVLPAGSALSPHQVIASLGIIQDHLADDSSDDIETRRRVSSAARILEVHLGDLMDAVYGDGAFSTYSRIRGQLLSEGTTLADLDITAEEEDLYLDIDQLFSGAQLTDGE